MIKKQRDIHMGYFYKKENIKKIYNFFPLLCKYYEGIATIFMLHRVYPFEPNKLHPNENI